MHTDTRMFLVFWRVYHCQITVKGGHCHDLKARILHVGTAKFVNVSKKCQGPLTLIFITFSVSQKLAIPFPFTSFDCILESIFLSLPCQNSILFLFLFLLSMGLGM